MTVMTIVVSPIFALRLTPSSLGCPLAKRINNNPVKEARVEPRVKDSCHSQTESQPSSYEQAHSPPQTCALMLGALASIQAASATSPQYAGQMQNGMEGVSNKGISEQLNSIIHLLEEQQNAKTSTTTEELILYTFLGVFTIYIVDSFTKVGKPYTR